MDRTDGLIRRETALFRLACRRLSGRGVRCYAAPMVETGDPAGWVAAIFIVAGLMFLYGLWAIRAGHVHVGSRWQCVYRAREPKSFWFIVIVFTILFPICVVVVAIWELGLLK